MNRYFGDNETTESERNAYELMGQGTRFYAAVLIARNIDQIVARAESAEVASAGLAESNQQHEETIRILRIEIGRAWSTIDEVRAALDAYPEHDVVQSAKRTAAMLKDVTAERDAARSERDSLARALATEQIDGDELRAKLEQAQKRINDLTEWDMDTALS
jgi:hypothetical protein